jgi:hypothetical protein
MAVERTLTRSVSVRVAFLALATMLAVTLVDVPHASAKNVARTVTTDPVGPPGLHFEGSVTANRGRCFKQVPVRIQKRRPNGTWRLWGSGMTDNTGFYSIGGGPAVKGRYRAVAPRIVRGTLVCLRAVSAVQTYTP